MSSCGLRLIILLLGSLAFLPIVHGDWSTASIPKNFSPTRIVPQKGVFLVAKRSMPDPRFQRTVVLLLAHGDRGTLGLIINRPTEILLSRALPDLQVPDEEPHALFFGGPVGVNMLIFLVRSGAPLQQAEHVMADVYYSADRDTLEQLLTEHRGAKELRMYVGHSGWASGQLATEIARGDWLLVQGDSKTLFEKDLERIWPELIEKHAPPREMIVDHRELESAATIAM